MAEGDGNAKSRFDPGNMTLGVAALFGVLATVTLTGVVGRVLRNEPDDFVFALVLLLVGAAAFAAAGLTLSGGLAQSLLAATGLLLTMFGLVVGLVVALRTADDVERPGLSASLAETGLRVKGKATAANLSSDTRLVLLIDGLVTRAGGTGYDPVTLQQSYVGPDSDGNVDFEIDALVPPGRFDAVGIKSWTSKGDAPEAGAESRPCSEYPRQVSTENFSTARNDAGTGCIVLPLPPVPAAPRLSLSWLGEADAAKRLKLAVATDNAPTRLYMAEEPCGSVDDATPRCAGARVAVRVQAQRDMKRNDVYRAVLQPTANGTLDASLEVPVPDRSERICADAQFVYEPTEELPDACTLEDLPVGRVAAGLARTPPASGVRRANARRRG